MPSIHINNPEIIAQGVREICGRWGFNLIVDDDPGYAPRSSITLVMWFKTEAKARAMANAINAAQAEAVSLEEAA